MWHQWMDENPYEAKDLVNNNHIIIARLMQADFKDGKSDGYLGAPYWVYNINNMANRRTLMPTTCTTYEPLPIEELNWIEEFDESIQMVVPAHDCLEAVHQQSNQQCRCLFGRPPPSPSRPVTPPPVP